MIKLFGGVVTKGPKLIQLSSLNFSKVFVPRVDRLFEDEEKSEKPEKPNRIPAIMSKCDPELFSRLVGENTLKKLSFEAVKRCLGYLERIDFPLPENMDEKHWEQLLKFQTMQARTMYIEAILFKNEDEKLDHINEVDNYPRLPLQVDEKVLEKFFEQDPENKSKWDKVVYAFEKIQYNGQEVWPFLREKDVKEVLSLWSETRIIKYFIYRSDLQVKKFKQNLRKTKNKLIHDAEAQKKKDWVKDAGEVKAYSLGHNSIFLRFHEKKMIQQEHLRVAQEFNEWGQPLVIDMSWYNKMTVQSRKSLFFRELSYATSFNRSANQPFQIHFTSADIDKIPEFRKVFPNIEEKLEIFTEKPVWEQFPRERLVYLTPDSRNEIEYDDDDIYVIGGLVDKPLLPKATLSMAKEKRIRHAKLPLHRVLGFNVVLNVETMVAILADYRATKDWMYAFRWVSPRCFRAKLASQPYTFKEEFIYFAQRELHPETYYHDNGRLNKLQYKQKFLEILQQAPKDTALQNPEKYATEKRGKYDKYEKNANFFL